MAILQPEIYGLFGLGEFGAASYGRGAPIKIAFSIPNGTLLETRVLGSIINVDVASSLIVTEITGKLLLQ